MEDFISHYCCNQKIKIPDENHRVMLVSRSLLGVQTVRDKLCLHDRTAKRENKQVQNMKSMNTGCRKNSHDDVPQRSIGLPPVLALLYANEKITLDTNAFNVQVRCDLLQKQPDKLCLFLA